MHQTGPVKSQVKVVGSQDEIKGWDTSQLFHSRTETPELALVLLLQFKQLPWPVVALPELSYPVRTQPYQ